MHSTNINRSSVARLAVAGALATSMLLTACGSEQVTEPITNSARIEVTEEPGSSSIVGSDPHDITLTVGFGIIYRARIVDANGQPVSNARPTWHSTNPGVASVNPLPDSAGVDAARAAISARAVGTALVIASYNGMADTSRVSVIARVDTGGNPPVRPVAFDATIIVRGFVPGTDTASIGSMLIPGATVTLTRLPLLPTDTTTPGVTPVTVPTLFGTMTVDASSQVIFRNVPQSRFRVQVTPPAGTTWSSAEFTYGPPLVSTFGRIVTLTRP